MNRDEDHFTWATSIADYGAPSWGRKSSKMQRVFVVDAERRPFMPCRPAQARLLLRQGKAAVLRRFPYTIILKEAKPDAVVEPLRVKIDPGSKTTGMAVVNEASREVVFAAEMEHRGPLQIKAQGWQRRQMCLVDTYGFPRTKAKEQSRVYGFKTGDIVRAVVLTGAKAGTHVGKVAVRTRGAFNISTAHGLVPDISYRYCQSMHRADSYHYQKGERAFRPIP